MSVSQPGPGLLPARLACPHLSAQSPGAYWEPPSPAPGSHLPPRASLGRPDYPSPWLFTLS